ncbi:hypothetical protein ACFVP0_33905 [Streptomyces cinereoruber]|uniref:hypothetical protein n=1 Tax=Streptomyces cinereoruber TaxID=67260 RepID=UPI00367431C8
MPYAVIRDLEVGPIVLPGVTGSVGAVYPAHRADEPGWGAAVELPAVLKLLAAVDAGQITAAQARAAFTPFLDRLEEFDQEMERHLDYD